MNAPQHTKRPPPGRTRQHCQRPVAAFFAPLASRAAGPFFHAILDRIDAGLNEGAIEGQLPDGQPAHFGRARAGAGGGGATAQLARALRGWCAADRSAGMKAGRRVIGRAPIRCRFSTCSSRNRAALGAVARAIGLARLAGSVAHWLRRNSKAKARENIEAHYDLGNDFYAAWLDPTMTYSRRFSPAACVPDTLEAAQQRKIICCLIGCVCKPATVCSKSVAAGAGWQRPLWTRRAISYHGITLSPRTKDLCRRAAGGEGRCAASA